MNRLHISLLASAVFAIAISGCDNADPDTGLPPSGDVNATEDAAVSIANALSIDGGGAMDVVAAASELTVTSSATSSASGGFPDGCDHERSYDESSYTWTRFIECERGNPDGLFYAIFSRTGTYQFLNGDAPVQWPEEARSVNFDIVDGTGHAIAPGFVHELLDIGADLHVDNIHGDLVTVNGSYDRAATDTLYTREAERAIVYELSMDLQDVQVPPGDRHNWRNAVSGTIEGVYHAVITFIRGDSYTETEITKTFTIVFDDGDGDFSDALITLDGRTFRADLETGQVDGVN